MFKLKKEKIAIGAKTTILLVTVALLSGCPFIDDYEFKYHTIVGKTPVNLEELNTEYDDYNSDLPYPAGRQQIYFSSNRNSAGGNFDIVYKYFDISYHKKDDVVNIDWSDDNSENFEQELFKLVNTSTDQLGPLFREGNKGINYFFYASNDSGYFDIQLVYTPRAEWAYNGQKRLFGPLNLQSINSGSDDSYPTINNDFTQLWFCSNRENGQFDIYCVLLNPNEFLYEFLNKSDLVITKEEVLSGESDDKCPMIYGDYLIFTSDRPGGFGGFDLYYSKLVDNQWAAPVNFGLEINSSYDEYRPFPFQIEYKRVMVFSSNRPGGKGGFDLYAVRTDELN